MAKVADKYLVVDTWKVIEEGFDPTRNRVSESIFSLGNEYMGVRAYPEEGYSGDCLRGSYFNGLFEESKVPAHYKGIIRFLRFMVNSVDWLYTRINVNGEALDLATSTFSEFRRELDFKRGTYVRSFVWHLADGKQLKLTFERFVSMEVSNLGCQRIMFEPLNFSGEVTVRTGLDFSIIHEDQGRCFWESVKQEQINGVSAILGETVSTKNRLFSGFTIDVPHALDTKPVEENLFIGQDVTIKLTQGTASNFDKFVYNYAEKDLSISHDVMWSTTLEQVQSYVGASYVSLAQQQVNYWEKVWTESDIVIEGDPDNQQGIRFCIFNLYQTYHGDNPGFNIGAKGLTGEAYRGLAFWDTESYCLPFYIFNNPKAAKSLLEFRYQSLPHALERAKDLDCQGAFYPIATIDGTESCDLWQHSNLQLHVGTAVAYGIRHYVNITGDTEFLYEKGLEMLIQISRFYATRGQWGQQTGLYGYFGVMGPDEFQLMVNNNCYINLMAKKLFEFTLETIDNMSEHADQALIELATRLSLTDDEQADWSKKATLMKIPKDNETGIYEEHDGFFDMPHLDIHSIPVTEFPLYSNWSYDRLYRYDMIKQPDVLMFIFLYSGDYSSAEKLANYEYYESRCIHESSLSPSIHSIIAAEIGKDEEAYQFFEFATRLDLDNYNRNTREGLHTTSIAAAWMNIVYGFGGMRSDGNHLVLQPTIPTRWERYSFPISYKGSKLLIEVSKNSATIKTVAGEAVAVTIYGQEHYVGEKALEISLVKVG
ncbi:MAG: family 65 glycosyl hydrolase [Candidatus Pristimantibacillus lignocellulolyticus]|uniref:Family 65 glycosyl hydrolase n=1 Tax=Candidatus Pristimantibacillus lignocellulolyticus TaxID=2994561 RepID=A0A9J6ZBU5_9BACL|nr:MAG: family 65 glycosyl hydrolase [Candidatus Pristimantibacillus lignocellulolyticus]